MHMSDAEFESITQDFPGGPVAKTQIPERKGPGFNPRSGN